MIDGRRGRKDGDADLGDEDLDEEDLLVGSEVLQDEGARVAVSEDGDSDRSANPAHQPPDEAAPKRQNAFVRLLKAIGPWLVSVGVSADHVTVFGILVSACTGLLIGTGHFLEAIGVLTFGGLMDTLDGAVAKAAGTSSKRGAFFDSVSDRVADMLVFGGLAWYFAAGPGHDPKLAVLPLAILGVSNTISYERAKAESLGYEAKGGLMERAERLIAVGFALVWHVTLVPALFVILGLCIWTASQRFLKVWRQASAERPLPVPVLEAVPVGVAEAGSVLAAAGGANGATPSGLRARGAPRVESRWRAWREANATPERKRRRVAVASRARSRRRTETLSIRVRRAFKAEGAESRSSPRGSSGYRTPGGFGSNRSDRARSERRQKGTAAAFRRRLGPGS